MNRDDRKAANIRVLGRFLLIPAVLLIAWFPGCRVRPSEYPRPVLETAKRYVDGLAPDTLIPLTSDNQPVTRVISDEEIGRKAADALQLARPTLFRPAWTYGDVEIVVISNFRRMNEAERRAALNGHRVRDATSRLLLGVKPSIGGCDAYRFSSNGWSNGGVVLVDPAAHSMSPDGVARCVTAGFDYQLGVPPNGGTFDVNTFPETTASMVVLDYLRFCASTGKTEVSPPQRSNNGVTDFPSVRCIADGIGAALRRSRSP